VAWIGRTVAAALAAIHAATDEHGVALRMLHRDVTPANILIANDGTPRLIDLGIARSAETEAERTATGHVKGTLRYLAPELWQGAPHTPMTDLWSLGVTLLEAALGRVMVSGDALSVMRFLTTGKYRELRPGEALDPDLAAAIFALVTDDASRLRSAAAAANVFARIEEQLRDKHPKAVGGQQCLRAWVPWARPQGDDDGEADDDISTSSSDAAPTRVSKGDLPTATFSQVLAAPGDVLPVGAPTVQMPQWRAPEPKEANWDDEPTTLKRDPPPQPAINVDTVPLSVHEIRAHLAARRTTPEK
jgi:serine/threonine protein kinase